MTGPFPGESPSRCLDPENVLSARRLFWKENLWLSSDDTLLKVGCKKVNPLSNTCFETLEKSSLNMEASQGQQNQKTKHPRLLPHCIQDTCPRLSPRRTEEYSKTTVFRPNSYWIKEL